MYYSCRLFVLTKTQILIMRKRGKNFPLRSIVRNLSHKSVSVSKSTSFAENSFFAESFGRFSTVAERKKNLTESLHDVSNIIYSRDPDERFRFRSGRKTTTRGTAFTIIRTIMTCRGDRKSFFSIRRAYARTDPGDPPHA